MKSDCAQCWECLIYSVANRLKGLESCKLLCFSIAGISSSIAGISSSILALKQTQLGVYKEFVWDKEFI